MIQIAEYKHLCNKVRYYQDKINELERQYQLTKDFDLLNEIQRNRWALNLTTKRRDVLKMARDYD